MAPSGANTLDDYAVEKVSTPHWVGCGCMATCNPYQQGSPWLHDCDELRCPCSRRNRSKPAESDGGFVRTEVAYRVQLVEFDGGRNED